MASHANKLALALFAVALMIGGIAVVSLGKHFGDTRETSQSRTNQETVTIIAAIGAVPIGTKIDAKDVKEVRVPKESAAKDAMTAIGDVVGRSYRYELVADEVIFKQRLIDPALGQGLSSLIKPGTRAMAIRVDNVVGVAGFVGPGDAVDVIVTFDPWEYSRDRRDREDINRISKVVLQNIRVLAAGEQLQSDERKALAVPVVTLEVTPEQSERLALASAYGQVTLTLRSRVDVAVAPTPGVTPWDLLSREELESILTMKDRGEAPIGGVVINAAVPAANNGDGENVRAKRNRPPRDPRAVEPPPIAASPPTDRQPETVEIIRPQNSRK